MQATQPTLVPLSMFTDLCYFSSLFLANEIYHQFSRLPKTFSVCGLLDHVIAVKLKNCRTYLLLTTH